MKQQNNDEKFIKRCIELARESVDNGRNPFGCVITKGGEVVIETNNGSMEEITHHAEILAMQEAVKKLNTQDLSECTLYSNFEPCPMCAFMIREHKVGRVVFALTSPLMGGYTKWNILGDKDLSQFSPIFSDEPEVVIGVCKDEALKAFNEVGWTISSKQNGSKN